MKGGVQHAKEEEEKEGEEEQGRDGVLNERRRRRNAWQLEVLRRLDKLQHDVDAIQKAQVIAQDGINGLHVVTQRILRIDTEILKLLKELEAEGRLNRITARFERIRAA